MTKICSKCNILKELSEYRRNLSFCKTCENNTTIAYQNTLYGKFYLILNHAKKRAEKRKAKGRIEAGKYPLRSASPQFAPPGLAAVRFAHMLRITLSQLSFFNYLRSM